MGAALRLAFGTLTILPTGPVTVTPRVAGRAMTLAPVVVAPLAVLAALVAWAGQRLGLPPLLAGAAGVAVLAWGTRALHLDGLADTADGLGSGWDRDRALAVMKRGDVGPFGVVTLVLVLLAQASCLGFLAGSPVLVAVLVCVSRCAVPTLCRRGLPAARPDGLGAAVVGTVGPAVLVVTWLVAVAIMVLLPSSRTPILPLVVVPPVCLVAVWWLGRTAVKRFGGITGDVIGASVELALTVGLVATTVLLAGPGPR